MSSAPSIMVSSTFYDLHQIRADLGNFIMNLGYFPLLSELSSFPVNPDLDTIENCCARVEKNADILVLVIGGRYGSIENTTEKSITNLEFLAARRKGIPVYAFIEKSVLSILPVWKKNPDADFSNVVDTSKLFEFVEYVRSEERVWTFPFETAEEIINVLRTQLSHLFYDSLMVRLRLNGTGLPPYFESIRPKSLKIIIEKPDAWEHRLFLQSWIDQVESRTDLVREYNTGLKIETAELVESISANKWIDTRLYELQQIVNSANHLINKSAQEAFGKPGEPGNAEEIVWISRMLGAILENMLKWAKRIRCARIEEPYDRLATELAITIDKLIFNFHKFPQESLSKLDELLKRVTPENPGVLEMSIILELSNVDAINEALNEIRRYYNDSRSN